jgi:4-hydroxy-3-methylbut-2-en-1-yl diphosphate reductase
MRQSSHPVNQTRSMRIIRASHLGMCFGVRDAIALAEAKARTAPLTILGDLVHNETVLTRLRSQGVTLARQVADLTTPTVMITAHGASDRAQSRVREQGHQVIEATCPLVLHAHRALQRLVKDGCHPVIIGRREHVEVRGMTEDLEGYDVVLTDADVVKLEERARFGVVAQTTQPIDRARWLVSLLQLRFPKAEVRFVDTVCRPTKDRQTAALELACRCDVVVVIGGAQSNNTRELVATCLEACDRVYHVQTAEDLRSVWFRASDAVGITAGTSTPDDVIDEVEQWLLAFADFQDRLTSSLSPVCCASTP